MNSMESIIRTIEKGQQLGKRFSFIKDKKIIWSSIGIQKYNGNYKVYVDEIEEGKMSDGEYAREDIKVFNTISEAFDFISQTTTISWNQLSYCKGQKIFNPDFD